MISRAMVPGMGMTPAGDRLGPFLIRGWWLTGPIESNDLILRGSRVAACWIFSSERRGPAGVTLRLELGHAVRDV